MDCNALWSGGRRIAMPSEAAMRAATIIVDNYVIVRGQPVAVVENAVAEIIDREIAKESAIIPVAICDHYEPVVSGHPLECRHCHYHRDAHREHWNESYNAWARKNGLPEDK